MEQKVEVESARNGAKSAPSGLGNAGFLNHITDHLPSLVGELNTFVRLLKLGIDSYPIFD
jgi:hypothetical protein